PPLTHRYQRGRKRRILPRLCHPDKDDTLDDHVTTLVHCCWRESQSSRGLAVAPRAVGLLDTKGKPQIA
ncbi:hypothetical protein DN612_21660, partial [Aeromonas caviae]